MVEGGALCAVQPPYGGTCRSNGGEGCDCDGVDTLAECVAGDVKLGGRPEEGVSEYVGREGFSCCE